MADNNTSRMASSRRPLNKSLIRAVGLLGFAAVALPAHAAPLQGFGNNIPLSFAVKQIVPDGYLVQYAPGVNQTEPVSWSGGQDWQTVLTTLLNSNQLQGQFNGQLLVVSSNGGASSSGAGITGPGFSITATPASTPASGPTLVNAPSNVPPAPTTVAVGAPVAPSPVQVSQASPAVNVAPLPVQNSIAASSAPAPAYNSGASSGDVWNVQNGQTLNNVLAVWANHAGWTLAYNTQTIYPIQANAQLTGSFESAVSMLINSIHADPRPYATFYEGNHALVVSDANHISQSQGQ